jgi:hypothetical protein
MVGGEEDEGTIEGGVGVVVGGVSSRSPDVEGP